MNHAAGIKNGLDVRQLLLNNRKRQLGHAPVAEDDFCLFKDFFFLIKFMQKNRLRLKIYHFTKLFKHIIGIDAEEILVDKIPMMQVSQQDCAHGKSLTFIVEGRRVVFPCPRAFLKLHQFCASRYACTWSITA